MLTRLGEWVVSKTYLCPWLKLDISRVFRDAEKQMINKSKQPDCGWAYVRLVPDFNRNDKTHLIIPHISTNLFQCGISCSWKHCNQAIFRDSSLFFSQWGEFHFGGAFLFFCLCFNKLHVVLYFRILCMNVSLKSCENQVYNNTSSEMFSTQCHFNWW